MYYEFTVAYWGSYNHSHHYQSHWAPDLPWSLLAESTDRHWTILWNYQKLDLWNLWPNCLSLSRRAAPLSPAVLIDLIQQFLASAAPASIFQELARSNGSQVGWSTWRFRSPSYTFRFGRFLCCCRLKRLSRCRRAFAFGALALGLLRVAVIGCPSWELWFIHWNGH